MWMNQHEIEFVAKQHHDCPNVRKGIRLLHALMEAVNAQSDGWAYWRAPAKAAEKLQTLLQSAGILRHGTGVISEQDLKKAIVPIRSMITRQKKKQADRGNKFDFDVDAALTAQSSSIGIVCPSHGHHKIEDLLSHLEDIIDSVRIRIRDGRTEAAVSRLDEIQASVEKIRTELQGLDKTPTKGNADEHTQG